MVTRYGSGTLALLILGLAACARVDVPDRVELPRVAIDTQPAANLTTACIEHFDPEIDYFPHKLRFTHSTQLSVSYHGYYKRVTFTPAVDTREILTLVLVQCGAPRPELQPGEAVVAVPVARFATANVSMLFAVEALGLTSRLRGVPSKLAVTPLTIREAIDRGQVLEVGSGAHSNLELALALEPQVFFTFYSAYPASNIHRQLQRLGVAAAPQSDHTESTPLGRAEWLKYLALFFNTEAIADSIFTQSEARYTELRQHVQTLSPRPLAIVGYPETRGEWVLPGGRNHFAGLVADAGGRYFYDQDHRAGSLNYLPMERLYELAETAERWVGFTMPAPRSATIFAQEYPRLGWIGPVRADQLYWFDAGKNGRRNPYADQSMAAPEAMLADMIAAMHPTALVSSPPRFLRRIDGAPP